MRQARLLADRFCTLCAVVFCGLIVYQNLVVLQEQQRWMPLLYLLLVAVIAVLGAQLLPTKRWMPLAAFFLRFLCALVVIITLQVQPVQDFHTMYTAACQLAEGSHEYLNLADGYFHNWAYQSAFVAYQAGVIRLFGTGLLPLQLLNALYQGGTAALVWSLGCRLFPGKAGKAAGLLYLLYPGPLFLSAVLTNQHLSVFLLYLGLWLLVSPKDGNPGLPRLLLGGVLLALGNAIRPIGIIALLAAILWLLFMLLRRPKPRRGELLYGLLSPVLLTGSYWLTGQGLNQLIIRSGINPDGLTSNLPWWKFVLGFNQASNGTWNMEDYQTLYLAGDSDAMKAVALERLSAPLGQLLQLFLNKIRIMWGNFEDMSWGFAHLDGPRPLLGSLTVSDLVQALGNWEKGVYLLLFCLALIWLLRRLVKKNPDHRELLLVLLLCGYFAVHLLIEVQSRYRYFLMPTVALMAGGLLASLLNHRRKLGRREL